MVLHAEKISTTEFYSALNELKTMWETTHAEPSHVKPRTLNESSDETSERSCSEESS